MMGTLHALCESPFKFVNLTQVCNVNSAPSRTLPNKHSPLFLPLNFTNFKHFPCIQRFYATRLRQSNDKYLHRDKVLVEPIFFSVLFTHVSRHC
jgi:hypothetical protein